MAIKFKEWRITPEVQFTLGTDKYSPLARFVMPNERVSAQAVFEDTNLNQDIVKDIALEQDPSGLKLRLAVINFNQQTTSVKYVDIPTATATSNGPIDASTFAQIQENTRRIRNLESMDSGARVLSIVSGLGPDPADIDIWNAFLEDNDGIAPRKGDELINLDNSQRYLFVPTAVSPGDPEDEENYPVFPEPDADGNVPYRVWIMMAATNLNLVQEGGEGIVMDPPTQDEEGNPIDRDGCVKYWLPGIGQVVGWDVIKTDILQLQTTLSELESAIGNATIFRDGNIDEEPGDPNESDLTHDFIADTTREPIVGDRIINEWIENEIEKRLEYIFNGTNWIVMGTASGGSGGGSNPGGGGGGPVSLNRFVKLNDNSTGASSQGGVQDTGEDLNIPVPVTITTPTASETQATAGTSALRVITQTIVNNIASLFTKVATAQSTADNKQPKSTSNKQVGNASGGWDALSNATSNADGLMSSGDKNKLDGIATGATANAKETTATNIKMNGTQSAGSLNTFAAGDHVHPTDTSRAPSQAQLNSEIGTDTINESTDNVTNSVSQRDIGDVLQEIWKRLRIIRNSVVLKLNKPNVQQYQIVVQNQDGTVSGIQLDSANGSVYLRKDGTWGTPPSSGGGGTTWSNRTITIDDNTAAAAVTDQGPGANLVLGASHTSVATTASSTQSVGATTVTLRARIQTLINNIAYLFDFALGKPSVAWTNANSDGVLLQQSADRASRLVKSATATDYLGGDLSWKSIPTGLGAIAYSTPAAALAGSQADMAGLNFHYSTT